MPDLRYFALVLHGRFRLKGAIAASYGCSFTSLLVEVLEGYNPVEVPEGDSSIRTRESNCCGS